MVADGGARNFFQATRRAANAGSAAHLRPRRRLNMESTEEGRSSGMRRPASAEHGTPSVARQSGGIASLASSACSIRRWQQALLRIALQRNAASPMEKKERKSRRGGEEEASDRRSQNMPRRRRRRREARARTILQRTERGRKRGSVSSLVARSPFRRCQPRCGSSRRRAQSPDNRIERVIGKGRFPIGREVAILVKRSCGSYLPGHSRR